VIIMTNPLDLSQHPCFNQENRHRFMRLHLPVAPRCNVQCNFCNRRFDCVNESRPGVTGELLTPEQAEWYLEKMVAIHPMIKVVGIAGPGDPFANPEETLETLSRVRARFPEMLLCLATNGLQLAPYISQLAELKVSHVSITVNAIDPDIAGKIYSWIRFGKRVIVGREAAKRLLENQQAAIPALKAAGIIVKINTVVIEGVNDHHVLEVASKVQSLGADILNPMPMHANREAAFGIQNVPSLVRIRELKEKIAKILPVMSHCTRCRADAVGYLGAAANEEDRQLLTQAAGRTAAGVGEAPAHPGPVAKLSGKYAAVATREGLLVDQHLGEAMTLTIYTLEDGKVKQVSRRDTPPSGGGDQRWEALAAGLNDCAVLLVSGIGPRPRQILTDAGVDVRQVEGLIDEIVPRALAGDGLKTYCVQSRKCGEACQGNGTGCG